MKIFKLLFMMLFPSLLLSAENYDFIVENSTMLSVYFNIFNAIAAMLTNDTYLSLLKLTFLLGGFFVFVGTVLTVWEGTNAKALSPYGKYLIVGTALLTLVFSTKSTMTVTTNNLPSFCSVSPATPSNNGTPFMVELPSVLAFTFATSNMIGRELTNLADSAFSIPNMYGSTSMKDSDGYLGSLKQAIKLLTMDPNKVTMNSSTTLPSSYDMTGALEKHFSKCIYEVANNKGIAGQEALTKFESSKDLEASIISFLSENFGDPSAQSAGAAYVTINGTTLTCQENYNLNLKNMFLKFKTELACSDKYKTLNGGALQLLTKQNVTPSELQGIAIQAGLINSLENSKRISGIGISGASYATGKSKAEFNQSSLATGTYMAEMMPYIQMTMRAILYGFFPFVFVVMLLPGGIKVLAQYAQTMLWIELWGPTAAVINMFVSMHAQDKLSGAYTNQGLNLTNSIDMLSDASTIAGYGSYLYASVPALTWLILKGSGSMLGNVTSGISAGFGANLASKSINQDAQDMNAVSSHNKEREASGAKAISFGEAMHFESLAAGAGRGGKMNAVFNNGLEAVTNAAHQADATSLRAATLAKEVSGTNENVAKTMAADKTLSYTTSKEKLEQSGIYNNGKLDMNKLESFGKTEGGQQVISMLKNSKEFKEAEKQGKSFNQWLETKSSVQALNETMKTEQENLKNQVTGVTDNKGNSNVDKVKEVNKGQSVTEAKKLETSIAELTSNKVFDENGNFNKSKYDEYVKSEAGQAAIKTITGSEEFKQSGMNMEKYIEKSAKITAQQKTRDLETLNKTQKGMTSQDETTGKSSKNITDITSSANVVKSEGQDNLTNAETFKKMTDVKENVGLISALGGSIESASNIYSDMKNWKTTQQEKEIMADIISKHRQGELLEKDYNRAVELTNKKESGQNLDRNEEQELKDLSNLKERGDIANQVLGKNRSPSDFATFMLSGSKEDSTAYDNLLKGNMSDIKLKSGLTGTQEAAIKSNPELGDIKAYQDVKDTLGDEWSQKLFEANKLAAIGGPMTGIAAGLASSIMDYSHSTKMLDNLQKDTKTTNSNLEKDNAKLSENKEKLKDNKLASTEREKIMKENNSLEKNIKSNKEKLSKLEKDTTKEKHNNKKNKGKIAAAITIGGGIMAMAGADNETLQKGIGKVADIADLATDIPDLALSALQDLVSKEKGTELTDEKIKEMLEKGYDIMGKEK